MKSDQHVHYRDNVTRYFFDTEFIEDGKTIELLSIGIVCEDGRELYLANVEADQSRANEWVRTNVLPHLPAPESPAWNTHRAIASIVTSFVQAGASTPEFWAYFADYDWVVFCQLFGKMIDLPKGWPMMCLDLKQLSIMLGSPEHPKQAGTPHNALEDARWNFELFKFLSSRYATNLSSSETSP